MSSVLSRTSILPAQKKGLPELLSEQTFLLSILPFTARVVGIHRTFASATDVVVRASQRSFRVLLGKGSGFLFLGRSGGSATIAAVAVATARFATRVFAATDVTAFGCFVEADMHAGAAEIIEEVEDRGLAAAGIAAAIATFVFAASGSFAALGRFATLGSFAALGRFTASRFAASTTRIAGEQLLEATEQIDLGQAAGLAAARFAAGRFAALRFFTTFGSFAAFGRFAALDRFAALGLIAATTVTATTTTTAEHPEQVEAETLAAKGDAH
jgi:hypothetical protein